MNAVTRNATRDVLPTTVIVLASDWDAGNDPVSYYASNTATCLNFNSSPAKPRSKLTPSRRTTMSDCVHGVVYNVVVCRVIP
jgi:hypothetical protein